jgi:hypothetical protein
VGAPDALIDGEARQIGASQSSAQTLFPPARIPLRTRMSAGGSTGFFGFGDSTCFVCIAGIFVERVGSRNTFDRLS